MTDQPHRVGAWTLSEFVSFQAATVAAVVGLLLTVHTSGASAVLGAVLLVAGVATMLISGMHLVLRRRREQPQRR